MSRLYDIYENFRTKVNLLSVGSISYDLGILNHRIFDDSKYSIFEVQIPNIESGEIFDHRTDSMIRSGQIFKDSILIRCFMLFNIRYSIFDRISNHRISNIEYSIDRISNIEYRISNIE